MNREHQARLKAELDAIQAWDENYQRDETHSAMAEVAFRIRQDRRLEIITELTRSGWISLVNKSPLGKTG
ncbi:MAG: hypothetical protein ABSD75_21080 [Terriglobales bacterium]